MTKQNQNPFAKLGLIIPETQRDYYDQYCQRQNIGKTNFDRRPFQRMVDLWFAGFSLAVRKHLKYDNPIKGKLHRFNTGVVFDSDSWRIHIIMLVAIDIKGNLKIVEHPQKMIDIANGFAAAGVPQIVSMLQSGNREPIWNLSEALDDLLQSESTNEEVTDSQRITTVLR